MYDMIGFRAYPEFDEWGDVSVFDEGEIELHIDSNELPYVFYPFTK